MKRNLFSSPSLTRVRAWVVLRRGLIAIITQIIIVLFFAFVTLALVDALRKMITLVQALALALPYLSAALTAQHISERNRQIREMFLTLPVTLRHTLLLSFPGVIRIVLRATVLPSVFFWVFEAMTLQQGVVITLGSSLASLLVINRFVQPSPWDVPLFGLRAILRGFLRVFKRSILLGLLANTLVLVVLLIFPSWWVNFISSPVGGNAPGELAFFLISPIGSILRMQSEGVSSWIAPVLVGILGASAVAAGVSLMRSLRTPLRVLEAAEFAAYQEGRPPATYLGRSGALDDAREDSVKEVEAEETEEKCIADLDQLEKQSARPYIENASPEKVVAEAFPLQPLPFALAFLMLAALFSIFSYIHDSLTWELVSKISGLGLWLWALHTFQVFQTPGALMHHLPGHWKSLLREQLRGSGWMLVGVNIAIAVALTFFRREPWWMFFENLALFTEANIMAAGILWLSLHEKRGTGPMGWAVMLPGLFLVVGPMLWWIGKTEEGSPPEAARSMAVILLGVYIALILLPACLRRGHLSGWQMNFPSPRPGQTKNPMALDRKGEEYLNAKAQKRAAKSQRRHEKQKRQL